MNRFTWMVALAGGVFWAAGLAGSAGGAVVALDRFDGQATGFAGDDPWLSGGNTQDGGGFRAKSGGQWIFRPLAAPLDAAQAPVWVAITGMASADFKGYCFLNATDGTDHGQMDGVGFRDEDLTGVAAGESSGVVRTAQQTFLVKVEAVNKRLAFTVWAGKGNGAELMNASGQITASPRRVQALQGKGDARVGGLFNAFGIKAGQVTFTRLAVATTAAEALGLAPGEGTGPTQVQEPLVSPTPRKPFVGADDRSSPAWIPWPKKVTLESGRMSLSSARIVAGEPGLAPLAAVLAEEIAASTGLALRVAAGPGRDGDVGLTLEKALKGEAYRLAVGDRATVAGGTYGAVAAGTVSLLQAIGGQGQAAALPRMTVEDSPDKAYRGLMIDLARKEHSIANLEQIVVLCRFYKIRFLQLHLTDDQGFTFPTRAFPKVLLQNRDGGVLYTAEQLTALVAYADARGVTIVPEFDIPGHSAALNRSDPDFWMIRGTKPYEHHASINFARDEVIRACETIIGEMCGVFQSSPYFHIGADEADYVYADQNVHFQETLKKLGLGPKDTHQLYRRFLIRMDAAVKKNGKRTIVWEGFGRESGGRFPIPKDVIVMLYENRFYAPHHLVEDGYTIINASWTPLYVLRVLPEYTPKIYDWNVDLFGEFTQDYAKTSWRQIAPNPRVSGSQICSWEQPQAIEIANLRWPLAAMSERVWNSQAGKSWANFQKRLAGADAVLERLVHTVHWTCHYTLDGKAPTAQSPAYVAPLVIDKPTFVRAGLFDPAGRQIGPLTEDHFRQAGK
ncbi:MAG: family 20 glycosylhydrolase [Planctomycetota bacterium]|nr:family 20 glycosylhydrolase [Planctomycetota bacterium]